MRMKKSLEEMLHLQNQLNLKFQDGIGRHVASYDGTG
ncbi:hypothetical protein L195_g061983, partial [Trifolium pratense]